MIMLMVIMLMVITIMMVTMTMTVAMTIIVMLMIVVMTAMKMGAIHLFRNLQQLMQHSPPPFSGGRAPEGAHTALPHLCELK